MDAVTFWTTCATDGIVLEPEQMQAMERYHDELIKWNKRVNLVSRQDIEHVYERHILHSLTILKYVELRAKARVIDVGTGGGFPGIPLKIARPDLYVMLVDSIAKKVKVTDMLAKHTGLRHIGAKTVRAEALADDKQFRGSFDMVAARAVAPLVQLASWTLPLMRPDGVLATLKGGDLSREIEETMRKFPELTISVIDIDMMGTTWFREHDKKLVLCRFAPPGEIQQVVREAREILTSAGQEPPLQVTPDVKDPGAGRLVPTVPPNEPDSDPATPVVPPSRPNTEPAVPTVPPSQPDAEPRVPTVPPLEPDPQPQTPTVPPVEPDPAPAPPTIPPL